MAATCMAVCKGSRKKIRGIFISSCHLPVAVECDIVILSEPGPIPQAPVGQFCRHNLSPRGDGNSIHGDLGITAVDTTYPREGTETIEISSLLHALGTQLIPARGRKLGADGHNAAPGAGHNLSPRGDGNAVHGGHTGFAGRTQLIPARGRKLTSALLFCLCCRT